MSLFSRRNRKKGMYATGFFLALGLFIAWIVPGSILPPPRVESTPTPTSAFSPIVQEQVAALSHPLPGGKTGIDVVVQLRNPNARAGITNYPVTITLVSPSGEEILSHQETTYILPGSLQYIVALELTLEAGQSFGSLEVALPPNPTFQELPGHVSLPTFNTFLRERTVRQINNQTVETQTGLVRNTSTFDWQRVDVAVVALDSNRKIIAAGKTVLGALAVNEQREFTVQWPQPTEAISQVIALPNTDVFRDDNFLRVLGNPESLR